jgi:flagellar biosynthetic protein FliR
VSFALPTASLIALALGSLRAAAWLVLSPPFSTRSIPGTVKGLLSIVIALPVMPQLAEKVPNLDGAGLILGAGEQIVVGAALGFLTALLFAAVQAAGSLLDLFGGFSVAFAFDPLSNTSTSIFGRFYNLLAVTLLFVTDGHEMVLRGFQQSYTALPLDSTLSFATLDRLITGGLAEMFLAALQIAGPIIAVMFVADIGLGLLNRVAPSLNAFSLGFPLKILLTLSLAGIAIIVLPQAVRTLITHGVEAMITLTKPG